MIQTPGRLEGRRRLGAKRESSQPWSSSRATTVNAPPPMGSFEEAKFQDTTPRNRHFQTSGECKNSDEGKHADHQLGSRTHLKASGNEGKHGSNETKYSESKCADSNERSYKDKPIFVDDIESASEDASLSDQTDEDELGRQDLRDDEEFSHSDSSFDTDDEEDENMPQARQLSSRPRDRETVSTESYSNSSAQSRDNGKYSSSTNVNKRQDEVDESDDMIDDDRGNSSDSSVCSEDFAGDDLSDLRRFVGEDVVVCFGEAWLLGTVARFQPNDGSAPLKCCGLRIQYEKADSEWLRDIEGDPDVQILDRSQSWAQKFNGIDIGEKVIGLYSRENSLWCPGVVTDKKPAPRTEPGESQQSPRFVVRFTNGQTGQCSCNNILVVQPSKCRKNSNSATSSQNENSSNTNVAGSKNGRSYSNSPNALTPTSWSYTNDQNDELSQSESESDSQSYRQYDQHLDTDETDTESDSDSGEFLSDDEFTGHGRRHHTPKYQRCRSSSIEFSWQQDRLRNTHVNDGPPKDSNGATNKNRTSRRGAAVSILQRPSPSTAAASSLIRAAHNRNSKSREKLLHNPQMLLELPLEELVEGGFARQVLSDVTRSPRMDLGRIDRWTHCKCRCTDVNKTEFYLYEERTEEILLTAKRIGENFYISQYSEFPELVTASNLNQHTQSVCGVLHYCGSSRCNHPASRNRRARRVAGVARCQLWSTSCDLCDNALAKYVCGPAALDSTSISRTNSKSSDRWPKELTAAETELVELKRLGCRQLLAEFTQSNIEVRMGPTREDTDTDAHSHESKCAVVEARRLSVAVPTLSTSKDGEQTHHCGWCDRMPRNHDTTLQLTSAVPVWSADAQRLTMCFEESKVREHSSKNFLVHELPDPLSVDKSLKSMRCLHTSNHSKHNATTRRKGRKNSEKSRSCLQFGKSAKRLFTLSYRYPMSPMQGFGLALSHFNWMPDQEN